MLFNSDVYYAMSLCNIIYDSIIVSLILCNVILWDIYYLIDLEFILSLMFIKHH